VIIKELSLGIRYFLRLFVNQESWKCNTPEIITRKLDILRDGISNCTTPSRKALGPTQPPIQRVPGALSLGVKTTEHSPPSSAEVKECVDLYLHSPERLHGVVLS
jgi:hypothetical protein